MFNANKGQGVTGKDSHELGKLQLDTLSFNALWIALTMGGLAIQDGLYHIFYWSFVFKHCDIIFFLVVEDLLFPCRIQKESRAR